MAVAADERGRTRMRESISVSRPWGVGDWAMLFSAEGSEDECKPAQDGFRRRMRGKKAGNATKSRTTGHPCIPP